jgi:hypothetical protein
MEYDKLKSVIDQVRGTTFAGMDTVTEVKLKGGKKNPMQGRVTKVTRGANTMVFSTTQCSAYEDMVKRRMVKEGLDPDTFTVQKRKWGTRVGHTPFIEHNGTKYLECFFISPGKTEYQLDGTPIDPSEIQGLPDTKPSESSQGGIEDKVVVRTFKLDSIQAIRIGGVALEKE